MLNKMFCIYKLPGTQCNYIMCNFHLIIKNKTINWFPVSDYSTPLNHLKHSILSSYIWNTVKEKKCPKVPYLLAIFYGMCQGPASAWGGLWEKWVMGEALISVLTDNDSVSSRCRLSLKVLSLCLRFVIILPSFFFLLIFPSFFWTESLILFTKATLSSRFWPLLIIS